MQVLPERRNGVVMISPKQLQDDLWKKCSYYSTDKMASVISMALELERPLLVEGPPGSGKTEISKVLSQLFDCDLIRLQCYEGLDEGKALYEWNYQKQIIDIQKTKETDVFGMDYLLPRPLLRSLMHQGRSVLLIDEIDKVDPEFEAFLMEILSDFQISIPEYGTVVAKERPIVVLTSNATRDLGDALRRRCIFLYVDFLPVNQEATIYMKKVPGITPILALETAQVMRFLRDELTLLKMPSVSEGMDLAMAAVANGLEHLNAEFIDQLNSLYLKTHEDQVQFKLKGGGKWVIQKL